VFVNGRIWTGEADAPWAEALAVRGERLAAVGTGSAVRALAGDGTEVVDLGGRFVAPGFIDAHLHLLDGGFSIQELRLDDVEALDDVQNVIAEWATSHSDREWVTGKGWSYSAFPGGLPTRGQLDAAVAHRPAWIVSYDEHTGWANSEALRRAGITRDTRDPVGGTIVRDASGEPTGALKEKAMDLVAARVPEPTREEKRAALGLAFVRLAAWGVTSVHHASFGRSQPDAEALALVREVQAAHPASVRVYAALKMANDPTPRVLAAHAALRERYASSRLRVGAVKGFVDGVVEAETAAMFDPYPGGGRGEANFTQEELDRVVAAYDREGWQVMLHAIGDRAIDMALSSFEHAARTNHSAGRRHRVEHIEVPRFEDLPRFAADGVVASTQALFASPGPNNDDVYVPKLGPERERRAMPFRSIDEAGAVQAFGSDWPVFSANVLLGLRCAVTRATLPGQRPEVWLPGQRIGIEAALRHFTRDAAWAAHEEGEKGTLAAGKLADFVVLAEDLTAIAPERIHEARVLRTVIGGRDAYVAAP